MSRERQLDLLVVGGGPAGSLLALLAARSGLRVRLLERAAFPRPKPCGGVLSPRAVKALERAGLLPCVLGSGAAPIRSIHLLGPGRERAELPYGAGLALERELLDLCLLESAAEAGVEVWTRTRVEALTPGLGSRPSRVGFRSRHGFVAEMEARWVAGAGGRHCPVRRALGASRLAGDARLSSTSRAAVAVSALFEGLAAPAGVCEMHLTGTGYCGVAAAGRGRTTAGMVLPALTWRRLGRLPERALRCGLAGFPSLAGRFEPLHVVSGPWATGSLRVRPPLTVPAGVALVGDALSRMEPITGEGMAAALAGARVAARWLCRFPDPASARGLHRALRRRVRGARRRSTVAAAFSRSALAARLGVAWLRRSPRLAASLGTRLAGPAGSPRRAAAPAPALQEEARS